MCGLDGHATDGMAENRQVHAAEPNAGMRLSGLDVCGRAIVLATCPADFHIRQQSGTKIIVLLTRITRGEKNAFVLEMNLKFAPRTLVTECYDIILTRVIYDR